MKKGLSFLAYWVPVFLWMGFIFWMSTDTFSAENTSEIIEPTVHWLFPWLSQLNIDLINEIFRKVAHVAEYFILGLLLFRAIKKSGSLTWCPRAALYTTVALVAYAASDEFHQSFTSSRVASAVDVCIDSAGGILSQAFIWYRDNMAGWVTALKGIHSPGSPE